ncbi:pre-mRNA-splicing factor Prp46p [[Candida] jaroonii]|uniref:Pre-mRNA-splicing factor Prp46p n=1 Tax=[Candida] jaroonii TaxID=467808 RepID=A0ACA9Y386_9ASCO|nr:pre-mRNA-splicing factor Prp46p [[Candida] jaroonii]
MHYQDLIDLEDPLIPPVDEASDAVYRASKLDFITSTNKQQPEEELSQEIEENHDESDKPKTTNWSLLRVIASAHTGWVRSLTVDPVTNKWFVTGGSDSLIKVWDLADSSLKATITGHIMAVRTTTVSSRFPYLFSGSEDRTVRCFDLERSNSPQGCEIRKYHGHVGSIFTMSLHPELDILVTGGSDAAARVWDIRSRVEVMTLVGHKNDITSIITSETEPQIITSSMDNTIRLWDIRKQSTALTITQHSKSIRAMIEHPKESTFTSSDSSGYIKQWLTTGDLLNEFKSPGIINTLAINHTNDNLFSGHHDGKFEIFDYKSGRSLQQSQTIPSPGSDQSSIYCSSFDLSGLRLFTGESDHSIKIWGQL